VFRWGFIFSAAFLLVLPAGAEQMLKLGSGVPLDSRGWPSPIHGGLVGFDIEIPNPDPFD
jgi:hypothetical protein